MSQGSSCSTDDDELFYQGSGTLLVPESVIRTINKVKPSNDPLDEPEFNSINYVNSLFPTEQSLLNIDDVIAQLRCKMRYVDYQIRPVVRMQSSVGKSGRDALMDAQQMIRKLFLQTLDIKCKAEESEETVKEITREIKQLDCAKRNLMSAVTTLNHLSVLVSGVETLRVLTSKRQYAAIVMPLQGLVEVIKHFADYTAIPQVKKLADEVNEIQTALSRQITVDFHEALTGSNARNFAPTRSLADACLVVNILDPKVKSELLKWFVGVELNEYLFLFNDCEESGWLDKIDLRFIWFKKHLFQCEDKFGSMFPPQWEVSERITVKFCQITRSELSKIMSKRVKEIDAKLLLYAIQRTYNFEQLLAVRFTGNTIYEESGSFKQHKIGKQRVPNKPSNRNNLTTDDPFADYQIEESDSSITISYHTPSPFHNIIGDCFLPYLYIYIESLNRNLYELMEKLVVESKYNFNQEQPSIAAVQGVLPYCADLFVLFKKFLLQCNQLSNGSPMLSLCSLFEKYLREYAIKILQNNLPKFGGNGSSNPLSTSVTNITRDIREISSPSSLIQNFLKEEVARFSKVEIARICCVLTTAEYCLETTQKLEEKVKEKVEPCLVDKINFSQVQDIFYSVISNCIQLLVQDLEIVCEPALIAMSRFQWQTVVSVGDQSAYINALTSHLKTSVSLIRDNLSSSRKYFTQFCMRFAHSFIPKFIHSLCKCKPLSTIGAEQLLLDTHMLKTMLLDLPLVGSQVPCRAPASYIKVVIKGMNRGEMILKVVMAPIKPDILFVNQFLKLLPESDIQSFQKVLEMKGLKTTEKNHLLSIFRPCHSSGFITGSSLSISPKHDASSMKKLKNLPKKNFVVEKKE